VSQSHAIDHSLKLKSFKIGTDITLRKCPLSDSFWVTLLTVGHSDRIG